MLRFRNWIRRSGRWLWLPVLGFSLGAESRSTAAAAWRQYDNCTLIDQPYNDGDSFHVRVGRRRYIFRLYFVDCPETSNAFPERVAEQGRHFGIDADQVPAAGRKASAFTAKALAKPFRVYTQRQDARGRSRRKRFFAMIRTADGEYLSTRLVKAGYARVFGAPTDLPDGMQARKYFARLRAREREARHARRGVWGFTRSSRPTNPEKPLEP